MSLVKEHNDLSSSSLYQKSDGHKNYDIQ